MSVTLYVTSEHRVPADSGARQSANIVVEPGELGELDEAKERHVALCLDTSGSMRWQVDPSTPDETSKLEKVKSGAEVALADELKHSDYVSVVAFSGEAETVVPMENWGEADEDQFWDAVSDLEPSGKTDIYGALEHAHEELRKAGSRDAVRRILLLTDGQHNPTGDTPSDPNFEQLAADIDESKVSIMAAGVGSDYDRHLMKTLADASQGNWHHLETEAEFAEFIGGELGRGGRVGIVAPDLEIDLDPQFSATEFLRQVGGQSQPGNVTWEDDGSTAIVSLGDLVEGESQLVTFELGIPGRPRLAGEEYTVADVRLRQDGETLAETDIVAEFVPLPEPKEPGSGEDGPGEGDKPEPPREISTTEEHLRNRYLNAINDAEPGEKLDELEEEIENEVKDDYPDLFEELVEKVEAVRDDETGILADPTTPGDLTERDDD